ncbi:DUF1573 domain-containing protein [Robertkochia aurantiaca]|uniref:DUF1573 domain-containing protein n=1 Tax=Robertkochia aurantiaca TaxID=2873700 RepID=UPI001CCB4FA1|nr:DUF1573 domain-containing protein [Robertkochia sp. 3YJGBD-33]
MKKTFLLVACAAMVSFTSCKDKASNKVKSENVEMAQERDQANDKFAAISFDKTEHDFGNITQGTPVETTFTLTNTGEAPLIITNAKSSCGCTVPDYPKDTPIAPGESAEILVKFNGSGRNQVQKTVTLMTNTANGTEYLKIKAFVEPKDAGAENTKA